MSQDIRKWFAKPRESGSGNGSKEKSLTAEKPPASSSQPGNLAQGIQECSGRRKTSKYFAKDEEKVNDKMDADKISDKKAQKGNLGSVTNKRPPPAKKVHKLESDDEDDDFVTPTSNKSSAKGTPNKKLKTGTGKGVPQKLIEEFDEDVGGSLDSTSSKSVGRGRGRGAKGPSAPSRSMDVDEIDEENEDVEPGKAAGRGRGGRGRGGGGRGGFMNFGERKDPPHKGEKEVPEGAPNCLDGLTFVLSGTLDSLEREEAEDLIKRHGGRVTGSVSKKTNYLLCDEDIGGRKSTKAKELGTPFLAEDGLFDMIRASIKAKPSSQVSNKSADKVVQPSPKKSPQKSEIKATTPVTAAEDKKRSTHGAALTKGTNLSTSRNMLPWTEKYRPKVPNDMVGNQSLVKQLHDWLSNWDDQFLHAGKQGKKKKQNDSAAKKAVLLSGTPGIGKTTAAKLVSKMLGFQTVEVNASDSRGKADSRIEKGISGSTSNSIKELVSNQSLGSNLKSSQSPKTVLIMDEVDGMSAGDRGGVADLIASIKISKVPVVCICNDRYSQKLKSLVNHCLLLSFRKPTKQQMAKRLSQIAKSEALQVNEIALEELAERVNGDMRMALNQLQYMSLSMSVIKFDDIKQRLQSSSKDEDISPFTAVDKLFSFNGGKLRMDERIDLSMSDPDLVPLIIQENYINYRPSSTGKDDNGMKRMDMLARAAESIADGDIVNVQIRRYRQWQLSQIGSLTSCIIPAALLHGQRETLEQGERNFNRFGGWLGKNSTTGKNYRLLEDLHVHLLASRESYLGRTSLRLDYFTPLVRQLTIPLRELPKDEAVEKVVEFMDLYSISMEDFDTIMEISKFKGHASPLDGIQPAVKAALTRAYNKGSSSRVIRTADLITLPGIRKAPKKRVAAMLEPVDEPSSVDETAIKEEETLTDTEEQQEEEEDSVDAEKKIRSDLESLNSKGIQVQMELKGSSTNSTTTKKGSAGRGKRNVETSDKKASAGRGSAASKRKR